jgi:hypothetical protein
MNYRQFIYRQMWSVYDFISFDRITQTRFLDFSFFVTETLPEYVEVERFIKVSRYNHYASSTTSKALIIIR